MWWGPEVTDLGLRSPFLVEEYLGLSRFMYNIYIVVVRKTAHEP